MKTSVEILLDKLDWKEIPTAASVELVSPDDDLIPHATHEGILDIMGHKIRVYRLSNGQRVFCADDLEAFFSAPLDPPSQ